MKKALAILSVCMIAIPLMPANAATADEKQDQVSSRPEDTAPTEAAETCKGALCGLSGTMAITSNYMFRGFSQTQNNPAVQGGLTYTFPVGLYANVWGSNVNFTDPIGKTATSELDTIVGLRRDIGENFNYDLNFDRYNYPGARYANYNEFNALLTYSVFTLGLGYTMNTFGFHSRGLYSNGTITLPVPPKYALNFNDVSIAGEFGHYSITKPAGNSYNDWSFTLSKAINQTYAIAAQYTDTNGRFNYAPMDGPQLLGTVTASF